MTESKFWETQRALSSEFSRYILGHPELEKQIPLDAQIVFLLNDDEEFNKHSMEVARSQREKDQPVVFIRVEGLRPPFESRLINPKLETASRL